MTVDADDLERIVDKVAARFEELRAEERKGPEAERLAKEQITNRVSIAAFTLTMLLSFLGFVRAGSDTTSAAHTTAAGKASDDVAGEWALYQARTSQRSAFQLARDQLVRDSRAFATDDPRVRLARFNHAEYGLEMRRIDRENAQVFFVIQDLAMAEAHHLRDAARLDRQTHWYDMGTRTLTLALVLISVTLLANRNYLFWLGLVVAAGGAVIAVNGYFLFV